GRVVKYLSVGAGKFKIAAGMTKLLVALPESNVLQRWDLTTFTRDLSVPLPIAHRAHGLAMGHASDGPLLIQDGAVPLFLDVRTMQVMTAPAAPPFGVRLSSFEERAVPMRASGDGRLFVA